MNYQLAEIFKSKIEGAVYADKLAGLFTEVTQSIQGVEKTFPVACGLEQDCSKESILKNLVPDAKYKTIIYFEDQGVVFSSKDGHYLNFISLIRLTGWVNLKKLKSTDCETGATCSLSGLIVADIIGRLFISPFNSAPYSKIQVLKISQIEKSRSIFTKYSYNDKTSYLMYPYDYFGLLIETKFSISQTCLTGIETTDADC